MVAVVAVVAVVVNHIVSIAECNKAEKEVEDEYTIDEAETAIEEVLGDDYQGKVTITEDQLYIKDSDQITSRYDRILISKIYQNTVDSEGNKLTDRTTYGLAAEWSGHNFMAFFGAKRAIDLNLDSRFRDNAWYTEWGTVALMIIGAL
ncbi:MAG: hypothetical protein J6A87_05490 [Clostridia bacterium]|nr:hypothetical protein [Clostridia bacterium]